jgi:hypothetical protein
MHWRWGTLRLIIDERDGMIRERIPSVNATAESSNNLQGCGKTPVLYQGIAFAMP